MVEYDQKFIWCMDENNLYVYALMQNSTFKILNVLIYSLM